MSQFITFINRTFVTEKYFFWYLLDIILLGSALGLMGNIINKKSIFEDLSFYALGMIIRFMIISYQYSRYKKKFSKILPLFFLVFLLIVIINFINLYLNLESNFYKSILSLFVATLVSLFMFQIVKKYDQMKFIFGYFTRFCTIFSGVFFDPVIIFSNFFFAKIFYLNPAYLFFLMNINQ